MRLSGHRILLVSILALSLAAVSCSTGSSVIEDQIDSSSREETPRSTPVPSDEETEGSGLTAAEEQAAIAGMEQTYWMLVDAYIEASSAPVNREHPVIEARMRGVARATIDRLHRELIEDGVAFSNPRNQRMIIEIDVLTSTTGRIRDCSILIADLVDVETGEVVETPSEVFVTENFYVLEDGVWKLDHWGDSVIVTSLDDCPVPPEGPRDGGPATPDPRNNL